MSPLNNLLLHMRSKSKVILVLILLISDIGAIIVATYYYTPSIRAPLQMQQSINFLYNKFSSVLAISDTFGEDLLKSMISLFVVVNPIGKVPLFVTLTERMERQNKKLVSKYIITTADPYLLRSLPCQVPP
jgi:MarC family integral membrane protein